MVNVTGLPAGARHPAVNMGNSANRCEVNSPCAERAHHSQYGCDRHSRTRNRTGAGVPSGDRKSTRLNSSHVAISYAVFCLKKKKLLTSPVIRTSDNWADGAAGGVSGAS